MTNFKDFTPPPPRGSDKVFTVYLINPLRISPVSLCMYVLQSISSILREFKKEKIDFEKWLLPNLNLLAYLSYQHQS